MNAESFDRTAARATTLQDELLEDLRMATPVLAIPPAMADPVPVREPETVDTPTVEVCVTPLRWSPISVEGGKGRREGMTLLAGPLRISLSGFGD